MHFTKGNISIIVVIALAISELLGRHSAMLKMADKSQVESTSAKQVLGLVTETAVVKPDIQAMQRQKLVDYAKTFLGTPYIYACEDPSKGFDCSGFINYVYTHFEVAVPRSSVEFTTMGKVVSVEDARPGDLILFTGTNNKIRIVGHIGIVVENTDTLKFIHSSSGDANSVIITPLNDYYRGRLMKIVDILSPSDQANVAVRERLQKGLYPVASLAGHGTL